MSVKIIFYCVFYCVLKTVLFLCYCITQLTPELLKYIVALIVDQLFVNTALYCRVSNLI